MRWKGYDPSAVSTAEKVPRFIYSLVEPAADGHVRSAIICSSLHPAPPASRQPRAKSRSMMKKQLIGLCRRGIVALAFRQAPVAAFAFEATLTPLANDSTHAKPPQVHSAGEWK